MQPVEDLSRQATLYPQTSQRTIAVLIDYIDQVNGGYQNELCSAFEVACRHLDQSLAIVVGRALDTPFPRATPYNTVYELVNRRSIDGVILVSSGLSAFCGVEGLASLCARLQGLPICSLGLAVPGVPSVVIEDALGMANLVDHLLFEHDRKRIGFLEGPESFEAETQRAAYTRALARHGLSLDPRVVAQGHFTAASGARATHELLDRGVPFDALICANDGMALGAIDALRERGLRVPRDVLVTGFDDSALGRCADPPLTTVRQPLDSMAALALSLVAQQLAGERVPEVSTLDVEFVVRASCGCSARPWISGPARPARCSLESSLALLAPTAFQRTSLKRMADTQPLFEVLKGELEFSNGALLPALEDCVVSSGAGHEVEVLDALVEDFRRIETVLAPHPSADALLASVRDWLQPALARAQARRSRNAEVSYNELSRASEHLASALSLDALRHALEQELSLLGVQDAWICRYLDPERRKLEPFLSLRQGNVQDFEEVPFEAELLFPPGARIDDRRHTWFVLPLASEQKNWGVLVIERTLDAVHCERLRELISAALKNIDLHQEIVEKTSLHERSTQERLATAERLHALGVLAGGVAHDLNNALGPLLALPDAMQKTLAQESLRGAERIELLGDLAAIKSAAQHASSTIRDLLTLGRQGRTPRVPLELNQLIAAALANGNARFTRGKPKLRLELAPDPLVIEGSESHICRALLNLVQNAFEAGGDSGEIVVQAERVSLGSVLTAYETIEPGEYAVVRVSDRGAGIPREILGRIFEPFFSRKPLSEASGSGLGLALVHGVVKEHRGFVNVESAPGRGTTFTLYFPSSEQQVKQSCPEPSPADGIGKILVLDDDPLQIRSAQRVLRGLGYEVTALTSGRTVCELFEKAHESAEEIAESPFDLVIIDMILNQDRDGLEVLERIRKLFVNQKALMVSGHAPTERSEAALAHGLPWLSKPYAADELGAAVARLLAVGPTPGGSAADWDEAPAVRLGPAESVSTRFA